MVRTSKGKMFRTRKLMRKKPREKGLQSLSRILANYNIDDRVDIIIDPAVHSGQPHRRFHGKTGIIVATQGKAMVVKIKDVNKEKQLIVTREHLRPSKSASLQQPAD
ncbi:MAG: 50S ribosomal protein L21e [Candidatus Odinarchaeota archaeon]